MRFSEIDPRTSLARIIANGNLAIDPEQKRVRRKKSPEKDLSNPTELVVEVKNFGQRQTDAATCTLKIEGQIVTCKLLSTNWHSKKEEPAMERVATLDDEAMLWLQLIIEEKLQKITPQSGGKVVLDSKRIIINLLDELTQRIRAVDLTPKPDETKRKLKSFSVNLTQ